MIALLERLHALPHVRAAASLDAEAALTYAPAEMAGDDDRAVLEQELAAFAARGGGEARKRLPNERTLIARRFDDVDLAVLCASEVDEAAVQRQLNVIAIRIKASSAGPASTRAPASVRAPGPSTTSPPSERFIVLPFASVQALEDALAALVGPVAKALLSRAREGAGVDAYSITSVLARRLVEEIANELPERNRQEWRARANALIDVAESTRARMPSAPAPAERRPTPPPPSARALPGAPDLRFAALERALVDRVGPLGKMMVQTATAELAASGRANDVNAFAERLAAQLPGELRAAFLAAAQSIIRAPRS